MERIRFIKRAQELGFSLKEIFELLSLRVAPGTTCDQVKRRTEEKIADVREKIASLRQMEKVLVKLAQTCQGHGPVSECPILETLDSEHISL